MGLMAKTVDNPCTDILQRREDETITSLFTVKTENTGINFELLLLPVTP
jgi:hypothetical protein